MYTNIDKRIEENLEKMLNDLAKLVSFDSELMPAEENAPFGPGAAACLAAAEDVIRGCGFEPHNYENYALSADTDASLPAGLDILAHLDVVPAGNGWSVTDPFEMKRVGEAVYGRGTSDDKGPALCALYAMRAIKECGIHLERNARLILGSDEECGSRDLMHYFKTQKSAPYSLSPDAEFPCINIEKGGISSDFTAKLPLPEALPRVTRVAAGVKSNVVPDRAECTIEGLAIDAAKACAAAWHCEGCRVEFTEEEKSLRVLVIGKTAHCMAPMEGCNALTALLELVKLMPLSPAPLHDALRAIAGLFPYGDYYGTALGIDLEDGKSGHTTMSFGILKYDSENGLLGNFNCRTCLSANDANTTDKIESAFRAAGLTREDNKMYAPHHVPADSFLVKTALGICEELTGKPQRPLCIGGGTYVHHIDNGLAFGCCWLDKDTHMHGADEFMPIEDLLFGCKAYARAIIRICGVKE